LSGSGKESDRDPDVSTPAGERSKAMTTHFERFPVVLVIAIALSAGRPTLAQPEVQAQENVLVVIADDVGVDQLSCYAEGCDQACSPLPSCDFPNTPNI